MKRHFQNWVETFVKGSSDPNHDSAFCVPSYDSGEYFQSTHALSSQMVSRNDGVASFRGKYPHVAFSS